MSSYFCLPTDLFNKLDTVWKWNNELMWNKSVSKATQNNTGTHPAACCTYSPTTKTPASLRKRNTLPWRPSSSRHTHSPGVIKSPTCASVNGRHFESCGLRTPQLFNQAPRSLRLMTLFLIWTPPYSLLATRGEHLIFRGSCQKMINACTKLALKTSINF